MNNLTSKQRKIVYVIAMGLLAIPIIWLGQPAQGLLASQREKHKLGEATLGNVDPASSTLNLVLLGMRGVAANLLWMEADHLKETKNWSELQARVESIILLQPHFRQVWEYQSWNLAYNVSAECDRVEDRFYWVKEGIKFIMRGTRRNNYIPDLFFTTGFYLGNKIGTADEKVQFRRYFVNDPKTELFNGGADPAINPSGQDNYLVAREWYLQANELVDQGNKQHRMASELFLAYPQRAIIALATALQREGRFEDARTNWAFAFLEWTQVYGMRLVPIPIGDAISYLTQQEPSRREDYLAMFEEQEDYVKEIHRDASEDDRVALMSRIQDMARKNVSYIYWRLRCDVEQSERMAEARRSYYEGRRLFYEPPQDFASAQLSLYSAMEAFQDVLDEYPDLASQNDPEIIEDALKAVIVWQDIVVNKQGEDLPETYPLKGLWENPDLANLRDEYTQQFLLWQGGGL